MMGDKNGCCSWRTKAAPAGPIEPFADGGSHRHEQANEHTKRRSDTKPLMSATLIALTAATAMAEDFGISACDRAGRLTFTNAFTNSVCTILRASVVTGPWAPHANAFRTNRDASLSVGPSGETEFFRALAVDLSNGREGFTNLTESYSLLSTVAGAGGATGAGVNKWQAAFENGPATNAQLSRPHIAMADDTDNLFIADKDAHGVRRVTPEGTISTVAGTSVAGSGPDAATPGTQVALNEPNGLWVRGDGTVYILDLQNGKVRRLDTNGMLATLFAVPGGIASGRGLWVKDDESLAYVSSGTVVKQWTPSGGVVDFATGFSQLGNLVIDPSGRVVVTDRNAHRVYRLETNGTRTVIAGNGTTSGGGDGQLATATGLAQVRAVWFLPTGAFLVGTDSGARVWYVDTSGVIHLFLNGTSANAHAGDGTWFYNPAELRTGPIRAITADREGNLLVTEHDAGYVRKIRFLRHVP